MTTYDSTFIIGQLGETELLFHGFVLYKKNSDGFAVMHELAGIFGNLLSAGQSFNSVKQRSQLFLACWFSIVKRLMKYIVLHIVQNLQVTCPLYNC